MKTFAELAFGTGSFMFTGAALSGLMSVLATLQVKFAKTVTLGVSLADCFDETAQKSELSCDCGFALLCVPPCVVHPFNPVLFYVLNTEGIGFNWRGSFERHTSTKQAVSHVW